MSNRLGTRMRVVRTLRGAAAVALLSVASVRPVAATCVAMSRESVAREEVVTVFSGTVEQLENVPAGQIVTFRVDRVWRGEPGYFAVVYHWQPPNVEPHLTFARFTRYLVIGYRPSARERAAFELPSEAGDFLVTNACAAAVFETGRGSGVQRALGGDPGYPPR